MLIETTRFGPLEVEEARIMSFADGLLGFPQHKRFALIQTSPDPVFFWLQSVDDADLAFVVCDPLTFVADYEVPVRADDLAGLGLDGLADAQLLVIVNKVGGELTGNLLGPLLVGSRTLQAKQLVLSDKRYGTRHRLMPARSEAVARTA